MLQIRSAAGTTGVEGEQFLVPIVAVSSAFRQVMFKLQLGNWQEMYGG